MSEIRSSGIDIMEQTQWAALPWNTFDWMQRIWCNILVLQCPGSEWLKLLFYNAYFHPSDWGDNQITLKPDQHSSSESCELSCFPLCLLAYYLKRLNNILRNLINYFTEHNFRKQERTRNCCREDRKTTERKEQKMKIWKAEAKGAEREQSLVWLYCPKTTYYYNISDWAKNK